MGKANVQLMVEWAIKTAADDRHGYSQVNREGNPDYDCSSFVSEALRAGGFQVSGSPTTRELAGVLERLGFIDMGGEVALCPGDILLNPGKHVAIASGNGKIVHARSDEEGGIKGRKPGDNTGHEIEESMYYTPAGGWGHVFRFTPALKYVEGLTDVELAALYISCGIWDGELLGKSKLDKGKVEKAVRDIAMSRLVAMGAYGNMPERKERVEADGFDYNEVQKWVNRRFGAL